MNNQIGLIWKNHLIALKNANKQAGYFPCFKSNFSKSEESGYRI